MEAVPVGDSSCVRFDVTLEGNLVEVRREDDNDDGVMVGWVEEARRRRRRSCTPSHAEREERSRFCALHARAEAFFMLAAAML